MIYKELETFKFHRILIKYRTPKGGMEIKTMTTFLCNGKMLET